VVRRSIDDDRIEPDDLPPDAEEDGIVPTAWSVAISDDYEDGEIRVVLLVEEVGTARDGISSHLTLASARRLRGALRTACKELGEDPGP
jgi:hypothetical protein